MLDDQIFKTVVDSVPLVSIDILLKRNNKALLGKRIDKPAQGCFFQWVVELTRMRLLVVR